MLIYGSYLFFDEKGMSHLLTAFFSSSKNNCKRLHIKYDKKHLLVCSQNISQA